MDLKNWKDTKESFRERERDRERETEGGREEVVMEGLNAGGNVDREREKGERRRERVLDISLARALPWRNKK